MEAADLHCDACNQSHPHPKGSVCFMAPSEAPKVQKSPLVFTSAVSRGHPDLQRTFLPPNWVLVLPDPQGWAGRGRKR